MFCPKCGVSLEENIDSCWKCGELITNDTDNEVLPVDEESNSQDLPEEAADESAKEKEVYENEQSETVAVQENEPAQTLDSNDFSEDYVVSDDPINPTEKKKGVDFNNLYILSGAVIVLIGIALFVYLQFFRIPSGNIGSLFGQQKNSSNQTGSSGKISDLNADTVKKWEDFLVKLSSDETTAAIVDEVAQGEDVSVQGPKMEEINTDMAALPTSGESYDEDYYIQQVQTIAQCKIMALQYEGISRKTVEFLNNLQIDSVEGAQEISDMLKDIAEKAYSDYLKARTVVDLQAISGYLSYQSGSLQELIMEHQYQAPATEESAEPQQEEESSGEENSGEKTD